MSEDRRALEALLDGELTEEQESSLVVWLEEDPQHLVEYVRALHTHTTLRALLGAEAALATEGHPTRDAPHSVERGPKRGRPRRLAAPRRWTGLALAAAACLLGLFGASWLLVGDDPPDPATATAPDQDDSVPGRRPRPRPPSSSSSHPERAPEAPKPTPEAPEPTPEAPKPTPEAPKPTPEEPKPRSSTSAQPDPVSQSKPTPEEPPLVLDLERGSIQQPAWKSGPRSLAAGEVLSTTKPVRLRAGGATLFLAAHSKLRLRGGRRLTLEAGAILVEGLGDPFEVQAGSLTFREVGTRFLISLERGGEVREITYEGRVGYSLTQSEQHGEVVAGEELRQERGALTVEAAKAARAYPSWLKRVASPARPLLRFEFSDPLSDPKVTTVGALSSGALHARPKRGLPYAGVEGDATLVTTPARGELWVRYLSQSGAPLVFRCRAKRSASVAFDFTLARPVAGRWVSLRVPLEAFRSFAGEALPEGTPIHIVYVFSKDARSQHAIDDLMIVSREDPR